MGSLNFDKINIVSNELSYLDTCKSLKELKSLDKFKKAICSVTIWLIDSEFLVISYSFVFFT